MTSSLIASAMLRDPLYHIECLTAPSYTKYLISSIRLSRMLTDRGTEFCGTQSHEYELYLAVEDIDHSRTKTKSPQTTKHPVFIRVTGLFERAPSAPMIDRKHFVHINPFQLAILSTFVLPHFGLGAVAPWWWSGSRGVRIVRIGRLSGLRARVGAITGLT